MKRAWIGMAVRLAAIGGLLIVWSCTDKGSNGDVDLPPPPAAVTDLHVVTVAPNWIELEWTAPVDDNEHGPVDSYDIRYTDYEPEEGDWDNATKVAWDRNPVPGGFPETFQVTGLTMGTTYYFALTCCDNDGQCSDISNMIEVSTPIEFEVEFPDAVLETAIRLKLNQPTGPIMYSSVLGITDLSVEDGSLSDLSGMEYCEGLVALFLLGNDVTDLTPISQLSQLRYLNLNGNDFQNINALAGMTQLEQLDIGFTPVSDLSPLASLTNLSFLSAHDNPIVDISALAGLVNLHELDLSACQIVDIGPLVDNSGIAQGDNVNLKDNPLSETSINTHIPALEARGVNVTF